MKKVLSILIAVTLLIGCCSISFGSFAAATATDAATLATLLNSETKFAAEKTEDADGNITHHTSGYQLSRTAAVNTGVSLSEANRAKLTNVVNSSYSKEYGKYIDATTGVVDFDAIVRDRLGLSDITATLVNKSVIGSEILGKDALAATTLDAADLVNAKVNASGTNKTYTFSLANIDLLVDQASETSSLAKMISTLIPSGLAEEIAASVAAKTSATTVDVQNFGYNSIAVTAVFSTANGAEELTSLKIVYKVEYNANVYSSNRLEVIPFKSITQVTTTFSGFQRFDEVNDLDAYEFVAALNEATDYAAQDKAGYKYQRNSLFSSDVALNMDSGSTLATVLGYFNQIPLIGTLVTQESLTAKVKEIITNDMNVKDYSGAVKVSENAGEKLGNVDYAVKATALKANDLYNLAYNPTTGLVSFNLANAVNPEKDGTSALGNLTNDFVAGTELRNRLTISLADGQGVSLVSDTDVCDASYTNITAYVQFNGADATNAYGAGTIDTLGVSYNCDLNAVLSGVGVTITGGVRNDSEANTFSYFTYEKGDVDQSMKVSIADAKTTLQSIVGTTKLTEMQTSLADMDNSSGVSIVDAKLILQKIAANIE